MDGCAPLMLVVEVLSSSTRPEDTIRKSADYARGGAGQYWIVDLDLRRIEAWKLIEESGSSSPTSMRSVRGPRWSSPG